MPPTSKSPRRNRRGGPAGAATRRKQAPPALSSPFERSATADRVGRLMHRAMNHTAGSHGYVMEVKKAHLATLRYIRDAIAIDDQRGRLWPAGLYIPANADSKAHWMGPCPPENRYSHDWTSGIGWGTASKGDGSLLAVASSPTVKGAIDGKSEAGVGMLFKPKATLTRVRIEPDLRFIGRHEWKVDLLPPAPILIINTHVVGRIFVGAFELNLATGKFEQITNFTWFPHVVFDAHNSGLGASMLFTVPFNVSGAQAAREVIMQSGHTYLIAVVAQVALRITTTLSNGQPFTVPARKIRHVGVAEWHRPRGLGESEDISPVGIDPTGLDMARPTIFWE